MADQGEGCSLGLVADAQENRCLRIEGHIAGKCCFGDGTLKCLIDTHHFTGALHLGAEVGIDPNELRHAEDRGLYRDQVALRPESGAKSRCAQLAAEHGFDRQTHHGYAGDLREERDGAACPRIDLKHENPWGIALRAREHHVLDIGQTDSAKCQHYSLRVVANGVLLIPIEMLRRIDGHGVAGVHAGGLDMFHDPRNEDALAVADGVDFHLCPFEELVN